MTPKQRASREKRDAAIAEAERAYTRALEHYNDAIRKARQDYEVAVVVAQTQWERENGDGE